MLNLLIAQFNKSYEEVKERARVYVTKDRAKILIKMQTAMWIKPIVSNLYSNLGAKFHNLGGKCE